MNPATNAHIVLQREIMTRVATAFLAGGTTAATTLVISTDPELIPGIVAPWNKELDHLVRPPKPFISDYVSDALSPSKLLKLTPLHCANFTSWSSISKLFDTHVSFDSPVRYYKAFEKRGIVYGSHTEFETILQTCRNKNKMDELIYFWGQDIKYLYYNHTTNQITKKVSDVFVDLEEEFRNEDSETDHEFIF